MCGYFAFVYVLPVLLSVVYNFVILESFYHEIPPVPLKMCVHVNSLPDDCLLPIFDRIPLSNLLRLDFVCLRWASLLTSACARRRTLALILYERRLDQMSFEIPFNDDFEVSFNGYRPYFNLPVPERLASLRMSYLVLNNPLGGRRNEEADTEVARFHHARRTGQLVTYFTDLFPNVDSLVIIHPRCVEGELNFVVDLLESSTWSLRTVKLWLETYEIDEKYVDPDMQHPIGTLLQAIANQQHLQQLILDVNGALYNQFTFPLESYSFIGQLKTLKLSLGLYESENSIWDIVQRFDSTKLGHICFGNFVIPSMDTMLNPKYEFTTKVRQLYWTFLFETVEQFSEFCWRFSSLSTLRLRWRPNITFTQLVSNLASLTELSHLKLKLCEYRDNAFALVQNDEHEISLPQIKLFELDIQMSSHLDFESLSPQVFPSVEVVILKPCIKCNICLPYSVPSYDSKICHRLLVLSLKAKFASSVRLYARNDDNSAFSDWSNPVTAEQDDALIDDENDEDDQPKEVNA